MAIPYTALDITERVASLMNDTAQTQYTFVNVLPYLNMAMDDLQTKFEANNVPVTNQSSVAIDVPAGDTVIAFNASPDPELPDDLIEIQQVWERQEDTNPWIPMRRMDFIPHYLEGQPISQFLIWAWIDQEIRVPESNTDNQIKLDYIKDLFTEITASTDEIHVLNSKPWLSYATAALCAQFIAENAARAKVLLGYAENEIDDVLGISAKGAQAIQTRRIPFRTSYRNRRIIA